MTGPSSTLADSLAGSMNRDRLPSVRIKGAQVEERMNIEHRASVLNNLPHTSTIAVTEYLPLEWTA
jgi:hypothetical protein